MLRITVRIIGTLCFSFGLLLWWARSNRPTVPKPPVSASAPAKTAVKRRATHASPALLSPMPPPPPKTAKVRVASSLPRWHPTPFGGAGLLLFAGSFALPKSKRKLKGELVLQKGAAMVIPSSWDEKQIARDITLYRSNQGMLGSYMSGIVSRFVSGQEAQTMTARTKFLATFNKYAEVQRESYKWQRYMQGGRAALEEDLADTRAQIELEKAKSALSEVGGDKELEALEKEARRLEVMVDIARKKKQLNEIEHPPAVPTPPPAQVVPTAAEKKEREKSRLEASEKEVQEAIRIDKADPTLTEEQKRRKLNLLEERLAEIHEELVKLL